jgi:hypothetical protein
LRGLNRGQIQVAEIVSPKQMGKYMSDHIYTKWIRTQTYFQRTQITTGSQTRNCNVEKIPSKRKSTPGHKKCYLE